MNLLLIAIGGALGSLARYGVSALALRAAPSLFPFGTLIVNALGCLAFGAVVGAAQQRLALSPETRLFVLVGLLGGFTTFSSYAYEGFVLMREGESLRALAYVMGHVLVGLAAVWAGLRLTT